MTGEGFLAWMVLFWAWTRKPAPVVRYVLDDSGTAMLRKAARKIDEKRALVGWGDDAKSRVEIMHTISADIDGRRYRLCVNDVMPDA